MNPLSIISALTGSGWKKVALGLGLLILVAVLTGLAAWRGYKAGYGSADLKRQAEVAELRETHALALAQAEAQARKRLEAETARAAVVERRYLAAARTISKQSRELTNQRIAHASHDVVADGSCRFGAEWVRLYNQALGAGDGGDAVPASASGAAGIATAASGPEVGVLQGDAAVTPEDILAHARDYGRRSRRMEAQLTALIEWAEGRVTP